jgi:translation initiation factor IF-2
VGDKVGFINLGSFARRGSDSRGRDAAPAPAPPRPPVPPQNQQRPGGPQGQQRPGGYQGQQRTGGYQGHGQRPGGNHPNFQRPGGQQYNRQPYQQNRQPAAPPKPQLSADAPGIILRPPIVVRELAEKMGKKPFQVIADLMGMGVFATVTQTIDTEVAIKICAKHGIRFETEKRDKAAHVVNAPKEVKVELDQDDRPETLKSRPPVITIMGHVDHGKTSLLDVIRKANVASGEAGGITQHIGAYTIAYPHPQRKEEIMQLTFLDTPGHAAFSAMRARGANVTDIVILVVAANDGVMPQTIEALAHAKAAKVPIIVAVNKADHPNANPMRVRQQLQDKGLVPDDWGGDTLYVDCSAITKVGIDKLIDSILLQAELLELKANPDRKAKGNVIESGVEPGGPVATVLVRKGTLRVGDVILCGEYYGKVRAMMDEEGDRLKAATPSVAVRVLGLNGVPDAGSEFSAVENERAARELAEQRAMDNKRAELEGDRPKRRTLEDIFGKMSDLNAKVLKVIVKADTQGSVEAICDALQKIDSNKVSLEIIHSAVGAVTLHDVQLAASSDGVILGFHTRVDSSAAESAKREGVQIKLYAIIYELIDHVKDAMAGLLDPLLKEVTVGQAEVRKLFELSKGGTVAGCAVINGRLVRGKMRVRRRNLVIYEGISLTLKRFQDEVTEVRSGMECGVRLEGFDDFQELDLIECYTTEKVAQKL